MPLPQGLLGWRCLEVNANFLEVKTARRPLLIRDWIGKHKGSELVFIVL